MIPSSTSATAPHSAQHYGILRKPAQTIATFSGTPEKWRDYYRSVRNYSITNFHVSHLLHTRPVRLSTYVPSGYYKDLDLPLAPVTDIKHSATSPSVKTEDENNDGVGARTRSSKTTETTSNDDPNDTTDASEDAYDFHVLIEQSENPDNILIRISKAYRKANFTLYQVIYATISSDVRDFLEGAPIGDGQLAWWMLHSKYARPTKTSRIQLLREFITINYNSADTMDTYTQRFLAILRKLHAFKYAFDKDLKMCLLLEGLPASFREFSREMLKDNFASLQDVVFKLQEHSQSIARWAKLDANRASQERLLHVPNAPCNKCGKTNHTEKFCKFKKKTPRFNIPKEISIRIRARVKAKTRVTCKNHGECYHTTAECSLEINKQKNSDKANLAYDIDELAQFNIIGHAFDEPDKGSGNCTPINHPMIDQPMDPPSLYRHNRGDYARTTRVPTSLYRHRPRIDSPPRHSPPECYPCDPRAPHGQIYTRDQVILAREATIDAILPDKHTFQQQHDRDLLFLDFTELDHIFEQKYNNIAHTTKYIPEKPTHLTLSIDDDDDDMSIASNSDNTYNNNTDNTSPQTPPTRLHNTNIPPRIKHAHTQRHVRCQPIPKPLASPFERCRQRILNVSSSTPDKLHECKKDNPFSCHFDPNRRQQETHATKPPIITNTPDDHIIAYLPSDDDYDPSLPTRDNNDDHVDDWSSIQNANWNNADMFFELSDDEDNSTPLSDDKHDTSPTDNEPSFQHIIDMLPKNNEPIDTFQQACLRIIANGTSSHKHVFKPFPDPKPNDTHSKPKPPHATQPPTPLSPYIPRPSDTTSLPVHHTEDINDFQACCLRIIGRGVSSHAPKRGPRNCTPNNRTSDPSHTEQQQLALLIHRGLKERDNHGRDRGHSHNPTSAHWLVDSGATTSISNIPINEWTNFTPISQKIGVAKKGNYLHIAGIGTVDGFQGVKYAPEASSSLLSVTALTHAGYTVTLSDRCTITDANGTEIFNVPRIGNLYPIPRKTCLNRLTPFRERLLNAVTIPPPDPYQKWHFRLGHPGKSLMKILQLQKRGTSDLLTKHITKAPSCTTCLSCKITKKPLNKTTTNTNAPPATTPYYRLFIDGLGPVLPRSYNGSSFALIVVDDHTGYKWALGLHHKSDSPQKIKRILTKITNLGHSVKIIRSDNAAEFLQGQLQDFFLDHKITHETTTPYMSSQNGRAERGIRTLTTIARSLLDHSRLHPRWWLHAIQHACLLNNYLPSTANPDNKSPFSLLHKKDPDLSRLRVFGSPTYCLNPNPKKSNRFLPNAELGYLVGQNPSKQSFLVFIPAKNRIFERYHVSIDESRPWRPNREIPYTNPLEPLDIPSSLPDDSAPNAAQSPPDTDVTQPSPDIVDTQPEDTHDNTHSEPSHSNEPDTPIRDSRDCTPNDQAIDPPTQQPNPPDSPRGEAPYTIPVKRYSRRARKQRYVWPFVRTAPSPLEYGAIDEPHPLHHPDYVANVMENDLPPVPTSYSQALKSPEADLWIEALEKELKTMDDMKVWDIVPHPGKDRRLVNSVIAFKRKLDENGNISQYKARICAAGYTQVADVDYDHTYAPTVDLTSVRILLAIAAHLSLDLTQGDFSAAFLNTVIDKPIYMRAPKHLNLKPGIVLRLNRAIYGLKQSARLWHLLLTNTLVKFGFKQLITDRCVYLLIRDDIIMLLCVYVDDIILASNCEKTTTEFYAYLNSKFPTKFLGKLKWCLGMLITRTPDTVTLSMEQYVTNLLAKYGMEDCNPASVPIAKGTPAPLEDLYNNTEHKPDFTLPVRELLGSLNFLATACRPDISFAVSYLARFVSKPSQLLLTSLKHVLRYLKQHKSYALTYRKLPTFKLEGWTDATWAGCRVDRRSTSGILTLAAGAPVTWQSKKQTTHAQSSSESELIAGCSGVKRIMYIRKLLQELHPLFPTSLPPTPIFQDNAGAILIQNNIGSIRRVRHLELRYYYSTQKVEDKQVRIVKVNTKDELADVLTKPLDKKTFHHLVSLFMTKPPPHPDPTPNSN